MLCISPLTDRKAGSVASDILENPAGYFLYECAVSEDVDNVSVIARLSSEEAAWRLSQLLGME